MTISVSSKGKHFWKFTLIRISENQVSKNENKEKKAGNEKLGVGSVAGGVHDEMTGFEFSTMECNFNSINQELIMWRWSAKK